MVGGPPVDADCASASRGLRVHAGRRSETRVILAKLEADGRTFASRRMRQQDRRWPTLGSALVANTIVRVDVTGPFCVGCGAVLAPVAPGEVRIRPCSSCGDHRSEYRASGTVEVGASVSAAYRVTTTATAAQRCDELATAIDAAEAATNAGDLREAKRATEAALQAIHQLADCANPRQRSAVEWTQEGWTSVQRERWTGLIGARNAAHHKPVAIVELQGDTSAPGHALRWAEMIPQLRYPEQQSAYDAVIAGEAAIPLLRAALADVTRSMV